MIKLLFSIIPYISSLNFLAERSNVLYNFAQFKLIAPEAVKKCQSINNEEKTGQTICLDKYNSR